ncbi:MAG: GNAT family N-acetyltransferase [Saprospiraceae bacterium]|nr:GNAT family N-acetyltransferase [Saprospiraceae bacterium]
MKIRKARKEDLEQIMQIWLDFMEYLQTINPDYYAVELDKEAFLDYLNGMLGQEEGNLLVATMGMEVLGFILARQEMLPGWFGGAKLGLIRYLAVKQGQQERGVGKALVSTTLAWFREQGIRRIELYVLDDLPASTFWKKLGFQPLMERRFLQLP